MSEEDIVRATFWNESMGHCDCCGKQSKTIWGDLADSSGTRAVYFVQWTVNEPEHMPNFDIVLGPWGMEPHQTTAYWFRCYTSLARVVALSWWLMAKEGVRMIAVFAVGRLSERTSSEPLWQMKSFRW